MSNNTEAMREALFVLESATSFMSKKARDKHRKVCANLRAALSQSQPLLTDKERGKAINRVGTLIERYTQGDQDAELAVHTDTTEPEQQRPVVGAVALGQPMGGGKDESTSHFKTQGVVALLKSIDEYGPHLDWLRHWTELPIGTKFYATPPQPAPQAEQRQEPVAFMEWRAKLAELVDAYIQGESDGEGAGDEAYAELKAHILATPFVTPQPQQWVGLTDADKQWLQSLGSRENTVMQTERILREKNGGSV